MSKQSDDSTSESDVHREETIRLSEHLKEKLQHRRSTLTLSTTSDDVFLSNDDETDSTLTRTTTSTHRPLKRDNTFTTYQIQSRRRTPIESQPFLVPFERKSTLKHDEFCLECQHRDALITKTRQRLLQIENTNRTLYEQLRSSILLNHRYQDENYRLKIHLNQLNQHLKHYQMKIETLKRNLQMKKAENSSSNVDHLQRLRQEVYQYNQMIATKREDQNKHFDYYSHARQT